MPDVDGLKSAVSRAVDDLRPALERTSLALHADPELAYQEHHSADRLGPLMLAMVSVEVEYTGRAAHAAARPYLGINALDAMVMSYNNISALRQVIRSDSRMHGIITDGGAAPNIIPAHAAGRFMVRSPDNRYLEQLKVKVQRCFEGAAVATGAELQLRWIDQCDTLTTNEPIVEAFSGNAAALGRAMRRRAQSDSHGSTDMGNV